MGARFLYGREFGGDVRCRLGRPPHAHFLHAHFGERLLRGRYHGIGPHLFFSHDGNLDLRDAQCLLQDASHCRHLYETGLHQKHGVEGGAAKEVFVAVVIFGHPRAKLGMSRAAADENFLVIHGNVLHCHDRLGSETADDEIHFVAGKEQFHGIGGVRDVEKFVGVGLHQFDLHLLLADLNSPFGIDFL
jgi:hypothetical protein